MIKQVTHDGFNYFLKPSFTFSQLIKVNEDIRAVFHARFVFFFLKREFEMFYFGRHFLMHFLT